MATKLSFYNMRITPSLLNMYIICPRECWLHANGIRMEHTSDTVYDGKLLHETSYPQRNEKHSEMELSAIFNNVELSGKIDFYDAKTKTIHETKRSDKAEEAHGWQVKFYIWLLELNGIEGAKATLEYPKLRKTDEVILTEADTDFLKQTILKIHELTEAETCPPKLNSKICKSCSYYELCYVGE